MGLFNLVWFVLFGAVLGLALLILSGVAMATIIGIPLGKSLYQLAKLSAFPFGKQVIRETKLKGSENVSSVRKIGGTIVNIVWFPIGVVLALAHLLVGIVAFATIIGIPVGVVLVRMANFLIFPIGAKVISKEEALAVNIANKIQESNKNEVK